MTFGEVKQLLYEMVVMYHSGAMVVWEKTKGVTPKPPYITLGYSNLNRSGFPLLDDDGECRYYNYSFTFEINLYTVGKEIQVTGGGTAYENTAVEDMEEFIRFLDSDGMTDRLVEKDVTIVMNPPIRDLSELIGDTKFNYRSMAEFTVTFAGTASGTYGVADSTVPNSSGGGMEEFAEVETYAIDEVIIKEETDDGD
ncbi:MAG: hypothetical protein LUH14_10370 [Clostridiaceae bacterium]|nr:hypothetical protein [Clostridiaceae bacterium]